MAGTVSRADFVLLGTGAFVVNAGGTLRFRFGADTGFSGNQTMYKGAVLEITKV